MKDMEDVILWPDGTWCYRHKLTEYGYMSDDYIVIESGTAMWSSFIKEEGYVE